MSIPDFLLVKEPIKPPGSFQCLCGRFARWTGQRSYFDGNFDCFSYDVDCTRCGPVTVECV